MAGRWCASGIGYTGDAGVEAQIRKAGQAPESALRQAAQARPCQGNSAGEVMVTFCEAASAVRVP